MKVTLKSSSLVQPSQPTWTGCMPLTEFDQIGDVTLYPTIYFYRPSSSWLITPGDAILTTLKTSLSKVLITFYPLAGRLYWLDGGRLEVDCNAQGARVIEASCEAKLGDYASSPDLYHHLIPRINYLTTPIQQIPLVVVQLTKFKCGGISLCYSISHVINDGQSSHHFVYEWARLARGEAIGSTPFLDRRALRAGEPAHPSGQSPRFHHPQFEPLPLCIGQVSNEGERKKKTVTARLNLSKTQVETLKNEANKNRKSHERVYTRFEAIAGYIWKCMCRARNNMSKQAVVLGICVDIRKRMDPPLPRNYFGNAIIDVIATSCSEDVIMKPLSYAAGRIREAIDSVTSEHVHSAIDYLKNMKDCSRLQDINAKRTTHEGPFYGNPNLWVISWMGFQQFYGLNFGWGKEFLMAPGPHDCDGVSNILPGYNGDRGSLVISLCLQDACMEDFKKLFYQDIDEFSKL